MADVSFIKFSPRQVGKHYIRHKWVTSKIQKARSRIAFIQKVLYCEVTLSIIKPKSHLVDLKDHHSAEKKSVYLKKFLPEYLLTTETLENAYLSK